MSEPREIKARREEGWRRMFDAALTQEERGLQVKLRRFFIKQNAELISVFERGTKARGDWFDEFARRARSLDPVADMDVLRATINDALGGIIDWDRQRVNLDNLLRPARAQALTAGMDTARKAYGIQAVRGPELTRGILDSGFAKLAHSEEITDTTRSLLARSFADGIAAGEGRSALVARVQEYMPGISEGRAGVIAATEAHAAISMGNYQQIVEAGFTSKRWKTTLDGSTRDAHRNMNGEEIPLDQPFSNGLMYPGDPSGPPGQIINCRCVLIPGNKVRKPVQQRVGLGSGGSEQMDSYKKTRVNIESVTYDPNDTIGLDKLIAHYENMIVNANVEHAYVFLEGKVYHAVGVGNQVHPEKILELGGIPSLEGAIIIHNHPIDATEFTFGRDDMIFAVESKLKTLIGCDTEYRYQITNIDKANLPEGYSIAMLVAQKEFEVSDALFSGKLNFEGDQYQHYVVNYICEALGVPYKREAIR